MQKLIFLTSICLLPIAGMSQQFRQQDSLAIVNTALDYVDGFYQADASRMERALHPMLAKRAYVPTKEGKFQYHELSALALVQGTRNARNYLKDRDRTTLKREIQVLDINRETATVKAYMEEWIDYMHLVKVEGQWKIINVLWELNTVDKK